MLQRFLAWCVASMGCWVPLYGPVMTNSLIDMIQYVAFSSYVEQQSVKTTSSATSCSYVAFSGLVCLLVFFFPPYFLIEACVLIYCEKDDHTRSWQAKVKKFGSAFLKLVFLMCVVGLTVLLTYVSALFWMPSTPKRKL